MKLPHHIVLLLTCWLSGGFFPIFAQPSSELLEIWYLKELILVADLNVDNKLSYGEMDRYVSAFAFYLERENFQLADKDDNQQIDIIELQQNSAKAYQFLLKKDEAAWKTLKGEYPYLADAKIKYLRRHPDLTAKLAGNLIWARSHPDLITQLIQGRFWLEDQPLVLRAIQENFIWLVENPDLADEFYGIKALDLYHSEMESWRFDHRNFVKKLSEEAGTTYAVDFSSFKTESIPTSSEETSSGLAFSSNRVEEYIEQIKTLTAEQDVLKVSFDQTQDSLNHELLKKKLELEEMKAVVEVYESMDSESSKSYDGTAPSLTDLETQLRQLTIEMKLARLEEDSLLAENIRQRKRITMLQDSMIVEIPIVETPIVDEGKYESPSIKAITSSSSLDSLATIVDQKEKEIYALNQANSFLTRERKKIEQSNKILKDSLDLSARLLITKSEDKTSRLADLDKEKQQLTRRIKALQAQNESSITSIHDLNQEVEKLMDEKAAALATLESIASKESALDPKTTILEEKVSALTTENETLKSSILKHKAAQKETKEKLTSIESDILQLQKEKETLALQLNEKKSSEASSSSAITSLQGEVSQLKKEKETLALQLNEKKSSEASSSSAITSLQGEVSQLKEDKEALAQQLSEKKYSEASTGSAMTNLQDEVSQLKKDKEALALQLNEKTSSEASKGSAMTSLQDEVSQLKKDKEALALQLNEKKSSEASTGSTITYLQGEVEQLKKDKETLAVELNEKNSSEASTGSAITYLQDEVRQLKQEKETLAVKLNEKKSSEASTGSAITYLQDEVRQLKQEKMAIMQQMEGVKTEYEKTHPEIRELQDKNAALSQEKLALELTIDQMEEEKSTPEAELMKLRQQVASVQEAKDKLERRSASLEDQLFHEKTLHEHYSDSLENQIVERTRQVSSLERALDEVTKPIVTSEPFDDTLDYSVYKRIEELNFDNSKLREQMELLAEAYDKNVEELKNSERQNRILALKFKKGKNKKKLPEAEAGAFLNEMALQLEFTRDQVKVLEMDNSRLRKQLETNYSYLDSFDEEKSGLVKDLSKNKANISRLSHREDSLTRELQIDNHIALSWADSLNNYKKELQNVQIKLKKAHTENQEARLFTRQLEDSLTYELHQLSDQLKTLSNRKDVNAQRIRILEEKEFELRRAQRDLLERTQLLRSKEAHIEAKMSSLGAKERKYQNLLEREKELDLREQRMKVYPKNKSVPLPRTGSN